MARATAAAAAANTPAASAARVAGVVGLALLCHSGGCREGRRFVDAVVVVKAVVRVVVVAVGMDVVVVVKVVVW